MSDREMMELILQKVTSTDDRMTGLEDRMTGLEDRMTSMEDRMTGLEDRMTGLEDRMTGMEKNVVVLTEAVSDLKAKMKVLQLNLENETHFGIKAIADGHFDISRKLDDVLKFKTQNEMLVVDVNLLKSDVRMLKTELDILKRKLECEAPLISMSL